MAANLGAIGANAPASSSADQELYWEWFQIADAGEIYLSRIFEKLYVDCQITQ